MLEWPEELYSPIDGTKLDDDWHIGYWARYRGRPVDRENHSSEFVEAWGWCDSEIREGIVDQG